MNSIPCRNFIFSFLLGDSKSPSNFILHYSIARLEWKYHRSTLSSVVTQILRRLTFLTLCEGRLEKLCDFVFQRSFAVSHLVQMSYTYCHSSESLWWIYGDYRLTVNLTLRILGYPTDKDNYNPDSGCLPPLVIAHNPTRVGELHSLVGSLQYCSWSTPMFSITMEFKFYLLPSGVFHWSTKHERTLCSIVD